MRRALLAFVALCACLASAVALTSGQDLLLFGKGVSASTLPSGAAAVWYADQFSASPMAAIPNAASPAPLSQNILRAPIHLFQNANYWTSSATTITDDAVSGPTGIASSAATMTASSSGWYIQSTTSVTIPAGTYTIAASVKSNTGASQGFAFTKDNTGTRATQTATTLWQRFSYTFTLGSPTGINRIFLCSDGTTSANLQVGDIEIYPGGSDLGAVNAGDANMYLGLSSYDPSTTSGTGYVDLSAGGTGIVQMPANASYSNITVQWVMNKVAAGSGYQAFLSKLQSYSSFTAAIAVGAAPTAYFGAAVYNSVPSYSETQYAGMWSLGGAGYHLMTLRYDGVKLEYFIDDIRMFVSYGSYTAPTIRDLAVNFVNVASLYAGNRYVGGALWSRAISNAELNSSLSYWTNRAAKNGIALSGATTDRILLAEGDSITGGFSYTYQYQASYSPSLLGTTFAFSGSGLSNIAARQPYEAATVPNSKNGRHFIFSVLDGANDLCTPDCATWEAAYQAVLNTAHSQGFLTACGTILPIDGNVTFNANRATVNPIIRGWLGTYCDAIFDFAADPTMGPDLSRTLHPTDWNDTTHPSSAGQAILAPIFAATVNGL